MLLKVTCEKATGHALLLQPLANNMVARLRISPDSATPDFRPPWPLSHLTNVTPHPGYQGVNRFRLWDRLASALGSHSRATDEPSQRAESGLTNGSAAFSRPPWSSGLWAGALSPVDSIAGDVTSCERRKSLLQLR